MNELEEALECFETGMNLGLSSTRVMGKVLATAYRQAQVEITGLEGIISQLRQRAVEAEYKLEEFRRQQ